MTTIFVFGSNLRGIHGAGAAKHARFQYNAQLGVASGRTGNAYAIPTKRNPTMKQEDTLPIEDIAQSVSSFLNYARANPSDTFIITNIGCGLAGYKPHQIAPLFNGASSNCIFSQEFKEYIT